MKLKSQCMKLLPEIFYFLSVSILIFISMEMIKEGIVTAYISLNYWLIAWCISGIMVIYTKENT